MLGRLSVSLSRILYSIFVKGLHQRTYPEKKFECEVCQACFRRSDSLAKHMYKHNDGKWLFRCELCPANFFSALKLEAHSRILTGEKPIKCDVCKKKFIVKANMVKHRKMHYEVKPFECKLCCYKSSTEQNLEFHVRTHTGENFNMVRHIKNHKS